MKKFLSCVTVALLVLVGSLFTHQESASASSQVVTVLKKDQKSSSTKRITVKKGQVLRIRVFPFNNKTIKWTIFKNGSSWTSDLVSGRAYDYTFKSIGAGQYSVRLYCGKYGGQTGCYGQGMLNVY
ncbi:MULTISPECIES: hypothetical protein [Bacillus]|uniref:hypothetical protein n=1 Tax=Bacillus TaxID=1386 RepID=UPI0022430C70|nr:MULTISPECIES: hypothetical protein [Bacillus]MCY7815228.1 hypothetical protein [Bacillus haynesii]MCY8224616.1 hypothetical protein [Bacillus haynesii]MCY8240937.1 hypothetical protein [Bacillus haynesii]MCY8399116.1 hypothetical protein [Bacillus haynesii]MCY8567156.1 hypothetical protein [Bacillus haynesii]